MSTAKARSPAMPYPDLEKNDGKLFWLAAYFQDLNHVLALRRVYTEMHRRGREEMILCGVSAAIGRLTDEANRSLVYVIKNGLLPFAHEGTTVFAAPGALQ